MTFATIEGRTILFWEAVSRFIDIFMIEAWFKKFVNPKWDNGTRNASTNAANFHHVVDFLRGRK